MLINIGLCKRSMSKYTTKAKILIIDDDKDINNLFKIYLEHDGYAVYSYQPNRCIILL